MPGPGRLYDGGMEGQIHELQAEDRAVSIRILQEAFHPDPWMRHCFFAGRAGYEARYRAYLEEGHDWHVAGGFPWLGVASGDGVVGVLYGMAPDPPSSVLPDLMDRLAERCGPDVRDRFLACERAAGAVEPAGRHHTLALLAVAPATQREGFGRALVRAWSERCDADPSSQGCILATARPENLPFYARHGYTEAASVPLGDGTNYVLVRPRGGAA